MDSKVQIKPLSAPRRWAALAVLLLAMLVLSLDMTIMDIALPSIAKELHPTSDQQLWIVDVYSLALVGLLVPLSSLSDRVGRKRTLLAGAVLFCLGSALAVVATNALAVIGIRAIMGFAAAMIMPTTASSIRNIFTDARERAIALALWSIMGGAGMAFGPILGGFLLGHFTWHAAFLVNIPLMGLAFVAGAVLLPEICIKKEGRIDLLAALVVVAGMVLTMFSVKHMAAELTLADPLMLAAFAVGVACIGWFVRRCLHADEPLLQVRLFKSRTFLAGILAALGAMFSMAGVLLLFSQWLQLACGYTPLEAGIRTLPMAITSLVGGAFAPSLAMRVGARPVMVGGLVMGGIAMASMVLLGDEITYAPVAVAMALVGLGTGSLSVGSAVIMCATPAQDASSGAALEEIAYDLANVLGVAVVGSVASIVYRLGFSVDALRALGLDEASIATALDSFGGAVSVAQATGVSALAEQGSAAFTESFVMAIVVGGIIMLAVAGLVWFLTPKGLQIIEEE